MLFPYSNALKKILKRITKVGVSTRIYKSFHFLKGHISHPLGCTEIMWFTQFYPHSKHHVLNALSIACTVQSVSIGT